MCFGARRIVLLGKTSDNRIQHQKHRYHQKHHRQFRPARQRVKLPFELLKTADFQKLFHRIRKPDFKLRSALWARHAQPLARPNRNAKLHIAAGAGNEFVLEIKTGK